MHVLFKKNLLFIQPAVDGFGSMGLKISRHCSTLYIRDLNLIICILLIDWCCIFSDEFCGTTQSEDMTENAENAEKAEKAAKEAAELRKGLRLNKTIIPYHYDLELWPRFYEGDDFSFTGKVTIHFTAKEESDVIVLHADTLTVHEDSIRLRYVLQRASEMIEQ